MRLALAIGLSLLGASLWAAEEAARDKARELLEQAYELPEVRAACTRNGETVVEVEVDGQAIPVDCRIWTRWHMARKETR